MLPVKIDRRVRVAMSDGVEIALTLYLPDRPGRFPVVVESNPFRKDDHTSAQDSYLFTYLAERGIAGARVDIRGTGASDGVLRGEYLGREQADSVEILAWLSAQDWCTGRLGMSGMTWGGFAALQTAMQRPSGLEAICVMHASHDRFSADVHYVGGALQGFDQIDRPVAIMATNGLPPDPSIVGERWMEMWISRLDASPQWLPEWIEHQQRDDFWRHGSVQEGYDAIDVPTLLIGGWLDPHVDGILALLENLGVPRRAIIGPWGRQRPSEGRPGPTIDHRAILHRWFAHWLLDEDSGVMDEPPLTMFVRTAPPYGPTDAEATGVWRGEPAWPPEDVVARRFHLGDGVLTDEPTVAPTVRFDGPWTTGTDVPFWSMGGWTFGDQSEEDQKPLVWASEVLTTPIEILGQPTVTIALVVEAVGGHLIARLSDVDEDGAVTFVTRGVLNLSHRSGSEDPASEPTNESFTVQVPMNATSIVFQPGHRIRLTVSGSEFPAVWPPPRVTPMVVDPSVSYLELPLVPPRGDDRLVTIEAATELADDSGRVMSDAGYEVTREADQLKVEKRNTFVDRLQDEENLERRWSQVSWMSASDSEPTSAVGGAVVEAELNRPTWSTKVITSALLAADEHAFHLDVALNAQLNGVEVWARRWVESIPRKWA